MVLRIGILQKKKSANVRTSLFSYRRFEVRLSSQLPRSQLWCTADCCAQIRGNGAVVLLYEEHDCRFCILATCGRLNNTRMPGTVKLKCFRLGAVMVPAAPRNNGFPLKLRCLR
jgi:hypothetical protein